MKNNKVLIVDDEADFGILMKFYLQKRGFQVFTAESIYDGLKILEEQRPEYIFFDNNLPDGLGWNNAEMVMEKYPDSHLVLMTAMQNSGVAPPPAHDILYKPFIVHELQKMFP